MRTSIAFFSLLLACQSDKNEPTNWAIGDIDVSWADSALTITAETGQTLFSSPAETSAIVWGIGEAEVEYGSGSFSFGLGELT